MLSESSRFPGALLAFVPAGLSFLAAFMAARSARTSKKAEIDASRIRDLEARLDERKYEMYKPMIQMMMDLLTSDTEPSTQEANRHAEQDQNLDNLSVLQEFATWITIFGSDEAVRSFHNFMQGMYTDAPAEVIFRLYSEFILAARRDMGDTESKVTRAEIIGMRVKDLYEGDHHMLEAVTVPLRVLAERSGWSIPWDSGHKAD
jgi:hypothetical protein